jgi:peroxiredoxin
MPPIFLASARIVIKPGWAITVNALLLAGTLAGTDQKMRKESLKMAVSPTDVTLDTPAPDFRLPATDGRTYTFADVAGKKGTMIVFICNHCPYVIASIDRLVADARALIPEGIGFAAICSNDATEYPEDSFANMKRFAEAHHFPFPYLHDESQSVARAYGAVCTPDFFGYDKETKLKYRGRLDEGRTSPPPEGARRELLEAMRMIAATGTAPANQPASMGCSIKWKAA